MERWKELEFDYARQLRESDTATRRSLYDEAYSHVAEFRTFASNKPEDRTAGTSKELVDLLAQILAEDENVLEVGCGRGYTCLTLAPQVKTIVGTDVTDSVLTEAQQVLEQHEVKNAAIVKVSAFELCSHFEAETFDSAISIEVVEHLHPEDAEEHFRQIFRVLKPGGKYIVVMPNRLDGPHDITRDVFPEMHEAIGFHLNESTYAQMAPTMREIGFNRFYSFHRIRGGRRKVFCLPYAINVMSEMLYKVLQTFNARISIIDNLIKIRLIAYKP